MEIISRLEEVRANAYMTLVDISSQRREIAGTELAPTAENTKFLNDCAEKLDTMETRLNEIIEDCDTKIKELRETS